MEMLQNMMGNPKRKEERNLEELEKQSNTEPKVLMELADLYRLGVQVPQDMEKEGALYHEAMKRGIPAY
jgi:hypothetical protein